MAEFNTIEVGFNQIDETINFGTRATAGDQVLYEVGTRAAIKCGESSESNVEITSRTKNGQFMFSTNKTLRIMNKEMSQVFANFEFKYNIDCFCVNEKYILIGTRDGKITIVALELQVDKPAENCDSDPIFTEIIEDEFCGKFFVGCFLGDCESFYIVTSLGLIKKIQLTGDREFKSHIIHDFKKRIKTCAFGSSHMLLEGDNLIILELENLTYEVDDAIGIEFVDFINTNYFSYDEKGNIYMITPKLITFCINNKYPELVNRFKKLLFITENESKGNFYIVGVTAEDDDKKSCIETITFPDMEKIYSIPINNPVHLTQMENSEEEFLFFSEVKKNGKIEEIRAQYIYEADPELRLKKLIQKQQFDAAELFAKTYDIDLDVVAKARAQNIVNKLFCTTADIDEFFAILDGISDHLFRLNCCDIVECELAVDTRRVLCYGAFMEINVRDTFENKDNPILAMKISFNRKLHRFDTYTQVNKNYSCQKWNYFMECNLLDEMKNVLNAGNFEAAIIIFDRLDVDSILSLTHEKIQDILGVINQTSRDIASFLAAFIPITLKYRPETLGIFVNWLHVRIYQMESQSSSDFVQSAIKFVEDVTKLMSLNVSIKKQFDNEESLNKLANLLKALKDIEMLQNDFGITLHVTDYLTDPIETIKILFATNMDNKNFEEFTKEFLCPFILNNNIDKDALFLQEIKNLLVYHEEYWVNLVTILLKYMDSIDKQVEAIKIILDTASVPWSPQVENIKKMLFKFQISSPVLQELLTFLKEEGRLAILRKYSINWNLFAQSNDKLFYYNEIFYKKGYDSVEDIRQLYTNDQDRNDNELSMVIKLIRKRNFTESLAVIDGNLPETILFVTKGIIDYVLYALHIFPEDQHGPFYVVLTSIFHRFRDNCTNPIELKNVENDYQKARSISLIRDNFNIETTRNNFDSKEEKDLLLDRLIKQVTEEITDDDVGLELILVKADFISRSIHEPMESVFAKFLNQVNFNAVVLLGEYALKFSKNPEYLSLCAVSLFKFLKVDFQANADETFLDVLVNIPNKDQDYLKGVCLARKLIIKAMMCTKDGQHLAIMELFQWVNSCFFFTNVRRNYLSEDVHQIYIPKLTAYPFASALECIKTLFNVYASYIGAFKIPTMKYVTAFSPLNDFNQSDLCKELEQLTWNLNALLKEEQHFTVFNIIKTLQYGLMHDPNIKQETLLYLSAYLQKTWLPQTVDMILSYKHIDKALLFNLMLMFGKSFVGPLYKQLQLYKRRPAKLLVITMVGFELLRYHNIEEGRDDLLNIINMCKWWNRAKGNLNYNTFFASQSEERLNDLITQGYINVDGVKEYSTDFGLDIQMSYMLYLKTILIMWEPDFKEEIDMMGKKIIVVKNDENMLLKKCEEVINRINDKSAVYNLAEKLWPAVNFYYYEVYIVLFSIQAALGGVKGSFKLCRPLLAFLKSYTRVSAPSRSEVEQWYGAFPLVAFIDSLSEYRLPLTNTFLSNDIWSIIKPEINLQTYKEWFKLANILGEYLSKLDICTYAINSVLGELTDCSSSEWELYPKYQHLIVQVDECAQNITDLERATAVVYTLMCGMPPGADKVNMAELSYKYAQAYKDSQLTKEVDKAYNKVKQRYFNYSAMHILYKYKLADNKYLNLVAQPQALISELYNDLRVVKQVDSVDFDCPDVNKAVDDLCVLFSLPVKKIRYDLLANLLKSNTFTDLDVTVSTQANKTQDSEENRLKRACYICTGPNTNLWRKTLFNIGMNDATFDSNMSFRANALKCFTSISDVQTIEAMSEMTYEEFIDHVDKILVIAEMSDLGICFENVHDLDEFNKKKLMRKLTQANGSARIKCVASLCKIYGLDDLKYWEFIVNSAIQSNMIKELKEYVEYLRGRCVTKFVQNAWHAILFDAFSLGSISKGDKLSADRVKTEYVKALRLLQTCPVTYGLNFDLYIQKCLFNNQPVIAAVLLRYLPKEKLEGFVETIWSGDSTFTELEALRAEGIVGIDDVIKSINDILF